jgi:hypothetical protein
MDTGFWLQCTIILKARKPQLCQPADLLPAIRELLPEKRKSTAGFNIF